MFRRSLPAFMGAPPMKKDNSRVVIHLAQKPPAPAKIDFSKIKLKYPVINENPRFKIPHATWSPKPAEPRAGLPFFVDRAGSGDGSFPVYTDYKGGRTRVDTIVRKVKGDAIAFQTELSKVVEGAEITMRPGKFVIRGNYKKRVKLWLLAMGF